MTLASVQPPSHGRLKPAKSLHTLNAGRVTTFDVDDRVRTAGHMLGHGRHDGSTQALSSFAAGRRPMSTAMSTMTLRQPDPLLTSLLEQPSPTVDTVPHHRASTLSAHDRRTPASSLRTAQSEHNLRPSTASVVHGAQMAGKDAITGESTTALSEAEIYQIKLMFSARDTSVVVCSCLVNVYFVPRRTSSPKTVKKDEWQLFATGVPVLLLEATATYRRLSLIVAERGTGFTLYRDTLDRLSEYTELGRTFHTHKQSTDHMLLTGLSFDSTYAAMTFLQQVQTWTADPQNVVLRAGEPKKSTSKNRRHSFSLTSSKRQSQLLNKTDISQPCCFNHVTSLTPEYLIEADQKRHQHMSQSYHSSGYGSTHSSNPAIVQPPRVAFESKRTVKLASPTDTEKQHSPSQSV